MLQRRFRPMKARRSSPWPLSVGLSAFTLIEVLVVVAIIGLLLAILIPSLRKAREQAKQVQCEGQLRELVHAALVYSSEHRGRLVGTGINDIPFLAQYDAGTRRDYLTWFGTWQPSIPRATCESYPAWRNAPHGGRLFRYYKNPGLLRCPSAEKYNGKISYSTPENVSMAMKDPSGQRNGLPPKMDLVAHPAFAIQFLDEDEEYSIATSSLDDGFGEPDRFADRHLGRATLAFFDGHCEAHYFPRGQTARYRQNRSLIPFEAWMIQVAPFNSRYTPRPWLWKGDSYSTYPKFKPRALVNYPVNPDRTPGPGCEPP